MGHDSGMMQGGMMGMMGGWMLLWALVGVAVLVVAALAAVWLTRRLSADRRDPLAAPGWPDGLPGAEELLRRRYAAGEIDREEYLRVQRDLAGG